MLKGQLQKGNNGLTKRKYITFGIEWSATRKVFPSFEKDRPEGAIKSFVDSPVFGRSAQVK